MMNLSLNLSSLNSLKEMIIITLLYNSTLLQFPAKKFTYREITYFCEYLQHIKFLKNREPNGSKHMVEI